MKHKIDAILLIRVNLLVSFCIHLNDSAKIKMHRNNVLLIYL